MRMELDPADAIDGSLIFCPQLYDAKEIAFLMENLDSHDNFIDIGAHVGLYALMASKRVTTGSVLAIEAAPRTFEMLTKNIRLNNSSIMGVNCGVSDKEETLKLHLQSSGNRGGSTFLERSGGNAVDVQCFTLVQVLRSLGVETVKGMKIDIEGYEYRVLKHFFENADPGMYPAFVITEFFPDRVPETTGDQIQLLEQYGYMEVLRTGYNRVLVSTMGTGRSQPC